ncbi:MAG TPA: hypothetical protein VFK49_06500 [Stellaceae bacterium]|nr:hypothetical protein [Stellaceae bacterium]
MPGTTALALLVLAQLSATEPSAAQVAPRDASPEVETLKERLSDKASDEQRVDNCRVAPERRGATPRPDCAAPTEPAQSSAAGARVDR